MIYYISEETREAQVTYVYGSAKVRVDPARVSGFRPGFRIENLKIQVSGRAGFRRGGLNLISGPGSGFKIKFFRLTRVIRGQPTEFQYDALRTVVKVFFLKLKIN